MPQWAKALVLGGVGLLIVFAIVEPRLSGGDSRATQLPVAPGAATAAAPAGTAVPREAGATGTPDGAQQQADEVESAFAAVQDRITADPGDADAWHDLGALLLTELAYTQAAEAFAQALEIDPGRAGTHAELGMALLRQGMVRVARGEFRRALDIDPSLAAAQLNLGITFSHVSPADLDAAREAWRSAIDLAPGSEVADRAQEYLDTYGAATATDQGAGERE